MVSKTSYPVWLKDLNANWPIKRVKHATYLKARVGWHGLTSSDYLDEGAILVTGTDFHQGQINWDTCYRVSEERYRQDPFIQLKEGDLLITKDGTIGKIALVKELSEPATLNSGVFVTRPLKDIYTNRYMYWLLSSKVFQAFIECIKVGTTIGHLYQRQLNDFAFPVPGLDTQEAIVTFLDRKTAAIDTLIAKKQRLIELLEEKRAALINQAVTKGLNPDVPMKDSGIPWIGEIPEHWTVTTVKRACSSVRDGSHNPPPRAEGEYRLLSARNIQHGEFILRDDDRLMDEAAFKELERSYTVRPGDVVVAVVGATTGKSAVVGAVEQVSVQRSIAILRVASSVTKAEYLNFWITSSAAQHEIAVIASKYSAQGGIYLEDLANLTFLLPPLEEQVKILDFLEKAFSPILKTEQQLNLQIKKLQEYRQSLITAAVTGKLEVPADEAA